jgi:hypothetical protein
LIPKADMDALKVNHDKFQKDSEELTGIKEKITKK